MTSDQINELRDTFRVALMGWDVPVSAKTVDTDTIDISFELWLTKFEGCFSIHSGEWSDGEDCPHYITNGESVWQWIAMQLHNKLPA